MNLKGLLALAMIGYAAVVFIFNRQMLFGDSVSINLLFTHVMWVKSLALFIVMAWGVVIGVLLHK